jgi:DNA-binding NarL/FixJ family response regulator
MRVVIAEDAVLLRSGLIRLLADEGIDAVAAVDNGDDLLGAVKEHRPDLVIVDVRMPPTFTDEGLRAAIGSHEAVPGLPVLVLVLSQYVEESYAVELLSGGAGGVGYLLKERVADINDFVDAVRRVAAGGTAIDPEVIAQLMARGRKNPLDALTARRVRSARPHGPRPVQHGHHELPRRLTRRGGKAHRQHLFETGPRSEFGGTPPRPRGPHLPRPRLTIVPMAARSSRRSHGPVSPLTLYSL